MILNIKRLLFSGFFILFLTPGILAQPWTFVKEQDGIKVYTRIEPNRSWKSYKGEVTFRANMDDVCSLLGSTTNHDWWDKAISDVKVLGYKEDKFIQYYLVFNMPFPFENRDIVTETTITTDTLTRISKYIARPLLNKVPEKSNLVRIKEYHQTWTVQAGDKGYVHVTLEGSINPGGNIPAWLFNMVITETPLKMLYSLRENSLSSKRTVK